MKFDETNLLITSSSTKIVGDLKVTGNIEYQGQATIEASNTYQTNSVVIGGSGTILFEGATADAHETVINAVDAAGDRTISLPNAF